MQLMGANKMSFSIKKSFVASDVITRPALQKFCSENKLPANENKDALVHHIESYANESEEHRQLVLDWLYEALQYGIRDVYVFPYADTLNFQALLGNVSELLKRLQDYLPNASKTHIGISKPQNVLGLVDFSLDSDENDKIHGISLVFTQLTYQERRKGSSFTYTPIECVVFVSIDIEKGWIHLLTRPQASLLQYSTATFSHTDDSNKRVKSEDIVVATKRQVMKILSIEGLPTHEAEQYARNAFYHLLRKYTFTPELIVGMLDNCSDALKQFAIELSQRCGLPMLDASYDKIAQDMRNITEKHISVNYADKGIFINDRKAYPTKIDVVGSDLSRVEESSVELPLQQTEIFFDNKRFMEDHQECTCLELCYNREKIKYVSEESFNVHFSTKRGGWLLKFKAYTLKEEIQYVLRDVIEASSSDK